MSNADQIVLADFGQKIIDILEDYSSWSNADASKNEIYERIADEAFNFGVELDG